MSAILFLVLLLLLTGALMAIYFARNRLGFSYEIAAVTLLLSLAALVIAGRELPLETSLSQWVLADKTGSWRLALDSGSLSLSFSYLAVACAAILFSIAGHGRIVRMTPGELTKTGLFLVLTVAVILACWSDNFGGLLVAQVMIAICWFALLWIESENGENQSAVYWLGMMLGAGLLLLWISALAAPDVWNEPVAALGLLGSARSLASTAAVIHMLVFPLAWWLLKSQRPVMETSVALMAPAVAGASLLAKTAADGFQGMPFQTPLITFGLIGLGVSALLALSFVGDKTRLLPILALAQISSIMLIGAWTGADGIRSEAVMLILANTALVLVSRFSQPRSSWYALWPIASIAGLPFTIAFSSRANLFQTLLAEGQMISALFFALVWMAIIASLLLAYSGQNNAGLQISLSDLRSLHAEAALLLLFLALFAWPVGRAGQMSLASWLLLLIPAFVAIPLAIGLRRRTGSQQSFAPLPDVDIPHVRLPKSAGWLIAGGGRLPRFLAAMLEGEGGWLWLLIFFVLIWLFRTG